MQKSCPQQRASEWVQMSGHPELQDRKTNLHKGKQTNQPNHQPNQNQTKWRLLSWSPQRRTRSNSNKPGTQKAYSLAWHNQQPDPTKPIAELGKNSSQTQYKNQQQNPAGISGPDSAKGDYHPNVDWWMNQGQQQKNRQQLSEHRLNG